MKGGEGGKLVFGRGGIKLVFEGLSINWSLGLGEIQGLPPPPPPPPPPMKPWCVWTPLLLCCCGFCLDILEYLNVLYHGSANLPYTLRIPLQILKRANLARLRPVVYFSCILHTEQKTPAFSAKDTYTPPPPPSLQLSSESCSFLTTALVTSMFWSAI